MTVISSVLVYDLCLNFNTFLIAKDSCFIISLCFVWFHQAGLKNKQRLYCYISPQSTFLHILDLTYQYPVQLVSPSSIISTYGNIRRYPIEPFPLFVCACSALITWCFVYKVTNLSSSIKISKMDIRKVRK